MIDELEKERVHKLRLVKETERGTLECQVVEWTARAKTAEEKCKTISKASEEAIGKAREGERKARQDKNSFVIDLQKKMEIGDTNVLYREGLRGYVFAQDGTAHTARGVGKRNGKSLGGSRKCEGRVNACRCRVKTDKEIA